MTKLQVNEERIALIHTLTTNDAVSVMESHASGLSEEEVAQRVIRFGKNIIEEKKGKSPFFIFLATMTTMMAVLLWAGAIIAIVAQMPELGIAIMMVNVINGTFSFWQEYRAGKATDALKKMLPATVRVIRDGKEIKLLAEDLVPGDILVISEGDKISADARLIMTSDLQINQSTLTGESNPVRKINDPILREGLSRNELANLIFTGTSVSSGTGKAVVFATGMSTEFGKIAKLTQSMTEEHSPLQKELDKLTKQISVIAMSIGIVFFIVSILFIQEPFAKSFIFSLGMIVAFIPEGLLPTVTLSLAIAVQRMAKEHALVKKLSAVETLGCTTVICSDKTGTLTQNEMTVSHLWTMTTEYEVTGLGYAPDGEIQHKKTQVSVASTPDLKALILSAALCSNARIVPPSTEINRYTVLGDPTEACLEVVAQKAGFNMERQNENLPRLRELPFDSRRKRMTTIHLAPVSKDGPKRIALTKGAPREVLELCTSIQINGLMHPITDAQREAIMNANDAYARNGLRVLAVAQRPLTSDLNLPVQLSAYTPELIETDLTFLGLVVMSDPPRPEVAAAIEECHRASIRVIMITGDYGLTAESIAKRIGIVKGEHPRVISGQELATLSTQSLQEALRGEVIFARVAPEQKYQVVTALQAMGEIVAVTGDGVNDAPALKKADIGIAMGIAGTDVAKEAADMILTDDNFASIVKAVEEGRTVYTNIRKFILYILNSNMPEGVPSSAFLLSRGAIPLPLSVMQILFIDLGTDMLPALGLGAEVAEKGVMNKPPRSQKEPLLNKSVMIKGFLWYGMLESVVAMAAYFFINWLYGWPGVPLAGSGTVYDQATTLTLASIVFAQIGMVLNCRTERESIFTVGIFSNRRVIQGIIVELILVVALMYVPFVRSVFQTAPVPLEGWIFLFCIPLPIVLIEEARKYYLRHYSKMEKRS